MNLRQLVLVNGNNDNDDDDDSRLSLVLLRESYVNVKRLTNSRFASGSVVTSRLRK